MSREPYDRIFLARHGETEWNLQRRRQGRLDSPLTDKGLKQAQRTASLLRSHSVDVVFSSPLGRAHRTAQLFADEVAAEVVVLDELAELDHGSFGGLTGDEINARFPDAVRARAMDKYNWRFPDGESYADVDLRAGSALRCIAESAARAPRGLCGRAEFRHAAGTVIIRGGGVVAVPGLLSG